MIYLYASLHAIFVLGMIFLWFLIDKRRDYKDYLRVCLLVGIPAGILIDVSGVLIFNLWSYSSVNVFEYLAIFFSSYVLGTPFFIETIEFISAYFSQKASRYGIKHISKTYYAVALALSFIVAAITAYTRYSHRSSMASELFFLIMAIAGIIFLDAFQGLFHSDGLLTRTIRGNWLVILTIFFSGLLPGVYWEVLNTNVRLWNYQNVPGPVILGVPVLVIGLWGFMNLTFWTISKIYHKLKLI